MKFFLSMLIMLTIAVTSIMSTSAMLTAPEQSLIETTVTQWISRYDIGERASRIETLRQKIETLITGQTLPADLVEALIAIDTFAHTLLPQDGIEEDAESSSDQSSSEPLDDSSLTTSTDQATPITFDDRFDPVVLAGVQGQVVAEFEMLARLEAFELEKLVVQSSDSSVHEIIAQMHLYDAAGNQLASDRPDSTGRFDFTLGSSYELPVGTTSIYAVIDTMVTGYFGNSTQEKFAFTLQIIDGEAQGVFSSTDYQIPNGDVSRLITIQSVLVDDLRLLESSNGAHVDTTLFGGRNTLAIIEITTADALSRETASPRELDILLETFTLEINDNTVAQSVPSSLTLERIDRSDSPIDGVDQGDGTVTFDLSSSETSSLIDDSAVYRLVADVTLSSNVSESLDFTIDDLRSGALTYRSSSDNGELFDIIDSESFQIDGDNLSD